MVDPLLKRLNQYHSKRWKLNEAYNIINDFLVKPHLLSIIEISNKMHRTKFSYTAEGDISSLKFQCERSKKGGFWNWIKALLMPYETCIKISNSNQLFLCEYYKHSFFEVAEKIKSDYDTKIKATIPYDFVIVCRAR